MTSFKGSGGPLWSLLNPRRKKSTSLWRWGFSKGRMPPLHQRLDMSMSALSKSWGRLLWTSCRTTNGKKTCWACSTSGREWVTPWAIQVSLLLFSPYQASLGQRMGLLPSSQAACVRWCSSEDPYQPIPKWLSGYRWSLWLRYEEEPLHLLEQAVPRAAQQRKQQQPNLMIIKHNIIRLYYNQITIYMPYISTFLQ